MNIGGDELLSDNREWIKERYCHIGGGTVPQNRAVGAQFWFQADSSEKNVQLG